MKCFLTIFLVAIFFLGCSNDNEEDFFSNNDGDELEGCMDPLACNYNAIASLDDGSCEYAEDIHYLPTVQDIIESKCNSCHAQGNINGLPVLNGYESLTSDIDNVMYRINSSDNLIMPPLGAIPLTDCEIMQIQNWYDNEMPI